MSSNNPFDSAASEQLSIIRHAIWDANQCLAGNELYLHPCTSTRDTKACSASLFVNAITNQEAAFATGPSDLFVRAAPDSLASPHWDRLAANKVIAVIPLVESNESFDIAQAAIALKQLRARGFRLAFHHAVVAPVYKSWQPLADFVMLDLASVQPGHLGPLVAAIHARTAATGIATQVESHAQFMQLQALGITLFQGKLLSEPEVISSRLLVHAEVAALELLNLVSQSAPIEAVENVLKKAPVLVVNLLQIIRSVGAGLSHKVTSLREAILLLGYDKLAKWSAVVLETAALSQTNSNLVHFDAMVRARMMELLAAQNTERLNPGSAFLIGLLSKLDNMLGSSMHTALAKLSMNNEISEFVLGRQGVYGDMLVLAKACESEREADFSRAFTKLDFTLRQIHKAHTDALAWADDVFHPDQLSYCTAASQDLALAA